MLRGPSITSVLSGQVIFEPIAREDAFKVVWLEEEAFREDTFKCLRVRVSKISALLIVEGMVKIFLSKSIGINRLKFASNPSLSPSVSPSVSRNQIKKTKRSSHPFINNTLILYSKRSNPIQIIRNPTRKALTSGPDISIIRNHHMGFIVSMVCRIGEVWVIFHNV